MYIEENLIKHFEEHLPIQVKTPIKEWENYQYAMKLNKQFFDSFNGIQSQQELELIKKLKKILESLMKRKREYVSLEEVKQIAQGIEVRK